jgi:hypothetical protein
MLESAFSDSKLEAELSETEDDDVDVGAVTDISLATSRLDVRFWSDDVDVDAMMDILLATSELDA